MREIAIRDNPRLVILVDDEDYELASRYRWMAHHQRSGDHHARRTTLLTDGPGHGRGIMLHRQLLGYPDRALVVDHINGNGLDNRRENLRLVTQRENSRNIHRPKGDKTLPVGVSWEKRVRQFVARIGRKHTCGKEFTLGYFEKLEDAIAERALANTLSDEQLVLRYPPIKPRKARP